MPSRPGTFRYKAFVEALQYSTTDLYHELFMLYQDRFSVQNPRIASGKLQRILESTFELANVQGFHAMSLRQLANSAGISMGGLYAYISSKDDLAWIIYSFLNHYCIEQLEQHLDKKTGYGNQLTSLIYIHLYLSELMQPWFYFAYMESKNLPQDQKQLAIKSEQLVEKKIMALIRKGIKAGEFRNVNVQLIAALTKAMLQDWYVKRGKYRQRKISVDSYGTGLIGLLMCQLVIQGDSG